MDKEIKDDFRTKQNKLEAEKRGTKKKEEVEAFQSEIDALVEESALKVDDLKEQFTDLKKLLEGLAPLQIITEAEYVVLRQHFGHVFEAGIGAEALAEIISKMDLVTILKKLKKLAENQSSAKLQKTLKRIKLIGSFIKNNIKPDWMVMTILPVLPPDLRPMVPLDGGRFATSDLNDLYRRVINRNNRLKRLQQIGAPEVITRNEKRMLQEACDAVINNAPRGGRVAYNAGDKRRYKSLTDILKGKQGRFRQNLLGKRVDYSGRSVIVVNPFLKLNQCGLPKKMALELFKPFVLGRLIRDEVASNIKQAEKIMERREKVVWDILDEVTAGNKVLLNRAPTLHRMGIQAFTPILVDGNAIQIHPLVCEAYNADFDGDQMAVHLPLSRAAQKEATEIMLSGQNLLKPASGEPITTPKQDMVLGLYYLTSLNEEGKGAGSIFGSVEEARLAHSLGHVHLLAPIKARVKGEMIDTTVGRMFFNEVMPESFDYINEPVGKKVVRNLFARIIEKEGKERLVQFTDDVKRLGFENATVSGLSMGIVGLETPAEKEGIISKANDKVAQLSKQFRYGLLTDQERYENTVKVWMATKREIAKITKGAIDPKNSIFMMIDSGSRGSWDNITQLLGMKGAVSSPSGKIIELPIKASMLEGFSIVEYFIGCHAGRKGLSDRALQTAKAGYLTRRLVDSVQDVIVREKDCGTVKFVEISRSESEKMKLNFIDRIFSRTLAEDVKEGKKVLAKKGEVISRQLSRQIERSKVEEIQVFSPVTCNTKNGVCQKCYGIDLATSEQVEVGTPIGIMAAQSIGEPGTQLTMNAIHGGGTAEASDITAGLPRVDELFEARTPKVEADMAPVDGTVQVKHQDHGFLVILHPAKQVEDIYTFTKEMEGAVKAGDEVNAKQILARAKGDDNKTTIKARAGGKVMEATPEQMVIARPKSEVFEFEVKNQADLLVTEGEQVKAGQKLSTGHLNLRKMLEVTDLQEVQNYIIKETQQVYSSQGIGIHDKHFEIITRQQLSKVRIIDEVDTNYLPGEVLARRDIEILNEKRGKKKPVRFEQLILGIGRVALSTDSWLSAAAFQETVKVLIEAATEKKVDRLEGIKENVIIGRLIPAGKNFKVKKA